MIQPSAHRTATASTRFAGILASVWLILLVLAGAAHGDLSFQFNIGEFGTGARQFQQPAGLAVNSSTGDLYVTDRLNNRIQQFGANGNFIQMWGYDVVASGEDNKPFANELQQVTIRATGGLFRLKYNGATVGGTGLGDLTSGSATVTNLAAVIAKTATYPNGGTFIQNVSPPDGWDLGSEVMGPGIQPGSVITELYPNWNGVGTVAFVISKPTTASGSGVTITSPGPAPFTVGQEISGPGIPAGTMIEAASPGTLTLSANATLTQAAVPLSASIPYNISSSQLQAILNSLPKVSAGGGSVSVSGGPGDPTGSSPYVITADGGPMAGKDIPEVVLNGTGLGVPMGSQLKCIGSAPTVVENGVLEYRWLANGQLIPGAGSQTYTIAAADTGKAIQCEVVGNYTGGSPPFKVINVLRDYALAGTAPSPAPPLGPVAGIAQPEQSATLGVGSGGGQTLTCKAGQWEGTPTSYTYQWYRNGQPLSSPTTTASTSNQYVTTAVDVATPAHFQCSVTATNASGSSILFSGLRPTSPAPGAGPFGTEVPKIAVEDGSGVAPALTTVNGGPVFEVCKANPPSTDVCKAGVEGSGPGQFRRPRGIAIDNSAGGEGAVYVADDRNYRVQKFTPIGTPVLTFGKDVNKSTAADVCTVASGDVCGNGLRNEDSNPGGFGGWIYTPEESSGAGAFDFSELGNTLAVDSSGDVYVADHYSYDIPGEEPPARIQKYNSSASFLGQVLAPGGEFGVSQKVVAIAVDSSKTVFGTTTGEARAVNMFTEPEFTLEGTQQSLGDRKVIHEDRHFPKQVAVDPVDDKIWITDRNRLGGGASQKICGEEGPTRVAIAAYDKENHMLDCDEPLGLGLLPTVSGLAVSPNGLVYASIMNQHRIKAFEVPQEAPPSIGAQSTSNITQETALLRGQVNPGFDPTTLWFEYGTEPCSDVPNPCTAVPSPDALYGADFLSVKMPIKGLEPGIKYYYRAVAENSLGTTPGPDRSFITFPFVDLVNDPCPNVLERKQTRTSAALDCRAYELVSADFTGGYDVVSDLVSGQTPFEGYPNAKDKALYAVRDGGIPNTGSPTNRGPDPYIATRQEDGTWKTQYVGIPADNPFATGPFSSTLADANADLNVFAFAGPAICSPCFPDGSTGIPLRLSDGSLIQGMAGSMTVEDPTSAGVVEKPLSADGLRFVFGSMQQFEEEGNPNDGNVTIYDRDLSTTPSTTQVVSTLPDGSTMTGAGIGQLDISEDGSRIVVAEELSAPDAKGNRYWHPYMHIGTSSSSVDLAPGATSGVLYGGMTADGSKVFFATKDKLVGGDTDTSADVYEAAVDSGGLLDLNLISIGAGGPSNSDACNPVGEPTSWNAPSGSGICNAVVLAGGAGVASGDGTFYFLSPELLDGPGNGLADEPNLYVVRPGAVPHFVATLDRASVHPPKAAPKHPAISTAFVSGLSTPESIAVDQSNGDIYVGERGKGGVSRFDSSGSPKNFTAGPGAGSSTITGLSLGGVGRHQIAFDNVPGSPFQGSFYVRKSASTLAVYASSGEELGTLTGFNEACGVTVDPSDGTVYVGDPLYPGIRRLVPTSNTTPVSKANYTETTLKTDAELFRPCQVAADGDGNVYAQRLFPNSPVQLFNETEFGPFEPLREGAEIKVAGSIPPTNTLATDPTTDELYVNTGTKIVILDTNQKPLKVFGEGTIFGSRGVAINASTKHVYAVNGSNVVEFGIEDEPYEPIDHPAVVHAMTDNEVHRYGDFQASPDDYALFATKLPLSESYDNAGFNMVYRYDAANDAIDCASCLPSEGVPSSDAQLPGYGLGLTDDGRVFFNSRDQLVMRDTNGKLDAYEWKDDGGEIDGDDVPNDVALISTGYSTFPSSLLSVTSDGKDAFFFTRETLVSRDVNGQAMKIYDAREGGGVFEVPDSPPCAASDECHGAGSVAAPPPPIGTFKGTGGQHVRGRGKCKKGFFKKRGTCVRKKRKKRARRAASRRQGGRR